MKSFLCMTLLAFSAATLNGATFHFAEQPACTSSAPWAGSMAFGDLNGDGAPDMLVNSAGNNWDGKTTQILMFFNKAGGFAGEPDRKIEFPHCFRMLIHDFDQDGKNDIGLVAGCHLYVLFHKDGFDLEKKRQFFNTNQRVTDMYVCKLNDAGIFDVLVGPVWRQFTLRGGELSAVNGYILGPQINDTGTTMPADVDADGVMDIVGVGRADNTLRVYYGPLLSLNVNPEELSDFLQLKVDGRVSGVAVADMNADGLADLIVADAKNRKTYIYFQNEPVGFDADAQPSLAIDGGGGAQAADLDGDGLSDLIVLDGHTKAAVFLQKPGWMIPASLAQADQVLQIPKSAACYLEDVTGDGVKDLIVKCSNGIIQVHPGLLPASETGGDHAKRE